MYILPQPYKCDKCGFTQEYSPHHTHNAPVLDEEPICPSCFEKFIRASCGVMKWDRGDKK